MWKRCLSTTRQLAKNNDLSKYYSPKILKSIELANSVIPKETTFKPNQIKFHPPYLDDFTKLDSYWDYKPGLPNAHTRDVSEITNFRWDAIPQPLTTLNLPPGVTVNSLQETDSSSAKSSKTSEISKGLNRLTGMDPRYILKNLTMKPLVTKRVSNQTAKGKIASFYALVVVGDKNGMVGLGEGKSRNAMSTAIFKAHWDAVRNLKQIPRYENRTIYGDINHRYHGVKLFLRSKRPGFGLRVNHIIFEICECAGIKDLSGKIYKSRNHMNVAKGTVEALLNSQKTLEEIALSRGKKIADVRNIYYSS